MVRKKTIKRIHGKPEVHDTPSSWITAERWFLSVLREVRQIEGEKKNG